MGAGAGAGALGADIAVAGGAPALALDIMNEGMAGGAMEPGVAAEEVEVEEAAPAAPTLRMRDPRAEVTLGLIVVETDPLVAVKGIALMAEAAAMVVVVEFMWVVEGERGAAGAGAADDGGAVVVVAVVVMVMEIGGKGGVEGKG